MIPASLPTLWIFRPEGPTPLGTVINTFAVDVIPAMVRFSVSPILLPTVNTEVLSVGTVSLFLNPLMYNLLLGAPTVSSTSNFNQLKFTSLAKFFCAGSMLTRYPLSSLLNASNLNPSAPNAFSPKLELELVIDESPPDSQIKCLPQPTANVDTSCNTASLDALI